MPTSEEGQRNRSKPWPMKLKEYLFYQFTENMEAINEDPDTFISTTKDQFEGCRLDRSLLNSYKCMFKKGKLKVKEKITIAPERKAFHQQAFLDTLRKLTKKEEV